jgi:hypothetical protein
LIRVAWFSHAPIRFFVDDYRFSAFFSTFSTFVDSHLVVPEYRSTPLCVCQRDINQSDRFAVAKPCTCVLP